MRILLFTLLVCLFSVNVVEAQSVPEKSANSEYVVNRLVRIKTRSGQVLKGRISHLEDGYMYLESEGIGEIKIPMDQIQSMEDLVSFPRFGNRDFHPDNHLLLWSSSAINLPAKTFQYRNQSLLFQTLTYGIRKDISLSLGSEVGSLVRGNANFNARIKWNVYRSGILQLAVGAQYWMYSFSSIPVISGKKGNRGRGFTFSGPNGDYDINEGMVNAIATVGNQSTFFNFGIGMGTHYYKVSTKPVLNAGFCVRLAKNISFVGESWLIPTRSDAEYFSFAGGGLRYGRIKSHFEIMAQTVQQSNGNTILPMIGYSVMF